VRHRGAGGDVVAQGARRGEAHVEVDGAGHRHGRRGHLGDGAVAPVGEVHRRARRRDGDARRLGAHAHAHAQGRRRAEVVDLEHLARTTQGHVGGVAVVAEHHGPGLGVGHREQRRTRHRRRHRRQRRRVEHRDAVGRAIDRHGDRVVRADRHCRAVGRRRARHPHRARVARARVARACVHGACVHGARVHGARVHRARVHRARVHRARVHRARVTRARVGPEVVGHRHVGARARVRRRSGVVRTPHRGERPRQRKQGQYVSLVSHDDEPPSATTKPQPWAKTVCPTYPCDAPSIPSG
jgi:hypothetical protein